MLDVLSRMTFLRCLLLVGVAGFAAWPLLESPVGAQLSVHPSDDKKLPPVPADEPIEGPVFLKCGPMLGHVAPDRALIWVKASNAARASVKVSLHADVRMGLTYKQFAKYALMKLGVETDITRFVRKNVPRRLAPREEVLARMTELGLTA